MRKGRALEGRLFPEEEMKAEAERKKKEEEIRQAELLKEQEAARITIQSYSQTWMKAKRAAGLKHTTLLRYQSILRAHLVPIFGSLPMVEVNRAKVRELVAHLGERGLKPKSVKNVLLCLSAIYTDAKEDEHVQHNPALRTSKLIKVRKCGEDVETFTHEEECRLLKKVKEYCPNYYPFILFLFRTGVREGEAVALRADDLDLHQRFAWIRRNFSAGRMPDTPKSRQKRQVDLSQDLTDT